MRKIQVVLMGALALFSGLAQSNEQQLKQQFDGFNELIQQAAQDVGFDGSYKLVVIRQDTEKSTLITAHYGEDTERMNKMAVRQIQKEEIGNMLSSQQIDLDEAYRMTMELMFPVTTSLQPRRGVSNALFFNQAQSDFLQSPVAVIGSDQLSLQWFLNNADEIHRLGAKVIVTQVKNRTDFQAIMALDNRLEYAPVDAEPVLRVFGVNYYPILLTKAGAFQ